MKKILLVLATVLLITGCVKTPKLENGEDVFLKIGDKEYSVQDIYNDLKANYGVMSIINLADKYVIGEELESTANEEAEAKAYVAQLKSYYESAGSNWTQVLASNGYTEDTLLDYYVTAYEKDAVAKKYVKANISDKEIETYYKDEIIGDITAKQILIVPENTENMTDEEKEEANKNALNKAKEVIEKLNNGGDFSELAKEYSSDSTSSLGGTLAPFNKQSSYPTEFINEAVSLNVNEYSKTPVKSTYGYHIIYIVSKADKPSLESVKDTIVNNLAEEKMSNDSEYQDKAFKALREKYNLNIYDTIVKERYEQIMTQY